MSKLEYFNSFLTERLMKVAGEIFEVFRDTVTEYQEEINRIKEENRLLKDKMSEVEQRAGSQTSFADAVKKHSSVTGPLDSDPSVIQVKLELATLKQECETQQSSSNPYTHTSNPARKAHSSEPDLNASEKVLEVHEESDLEMDTEVSVKAEPGESEAFPSANTSSAKVKNEAVGVWDEHEQESLSCSHCEQTFDEISHLASHMQSHVLLFSCEVCGKSFKNKGTLRTHMIVHQKERPFRCRLCGKAYSCAKVLNVHLISHNGERPFGCGYCEKRFKLKSHLKEHERIHTGEKPFSCPVCRKSFSRSNAVKIHVRSHHREHVPLSPNQ